jgi:hypothetical protein
VTRGAKVAAGAGGGLLILLLAWMAFTQWWLPERIRSELQASLDEHPRLIGEVGSVRLGWWPTSGSVRGTEIRAIDRQGQEHPFVAAERVDFSFRLRAFFNEIYDLQLTLVEPVIHYTDVHRWALRERPAEEEEPAEPTFAEMAAEWPSFLLRQLSVERGELHLDFQLESGLVQQQALQVQIEAENLSSRSALVDGQRGQVKIDGLVNEVGQVSLTATIAPFDEGMHTTLAVRTGEVDVVSFVHALGAWGVELQAGGVFIRQVADGEIEFDMDIVDGESSDFRFAGVLIDAAVDLSGRRRAEPFLEAPWARFDYRYREAENASEYSFDFKQPILRLREGDVNLFVGSDGEDETEEDSFFLIREITAQGATLDFGGAPEEAVRGIQLQSVDLLVRDLTNFSPLAEGRIGRVEINGRFAEGGELALAGEVQPFDEEITGWMQVMLKSVELHQLDLALRTAIGGPGQIGSFEAGQLVELQAAVAGEQGSFTEFDGHFVLEGLHVASSTPGLDVPVAGAESVGFEFLWDRELAALRIPLVRVQRPVLSLIDPEAPPEEENGEDDEEGPAPTRRMAAGIRDLIPFLVEEIAMDEGELFFLHQVEEDEIARIDVQELQLRAYNLTNRHHLAGGEPGEIAITGRPMGHAALDVRLSMDPLAEDISFDLVLQLVGLDLTTLNPYLQSYAYTKVKEGWFDLILELAANEGWVEGQARPFFREVDPFAPDEDAGLFDYIWEGITSLVARILERDDQIAARVPLSGPLDQPDADLWSTLGSLLRHAFVEALGFELERSPTREEVTPGRGQGERR